MATVEKYVDPYSLYTELRKLFFLPISLALGPESYSFVYHGRKFFTSKLIRFLPRPPSPSKLLGLASPSFTPKNRSLARRNLFSINGGGTPFFTTMKITPDTDLSALLLTKHHRQKDNPPPLNPIPDLPKKQLISRKARKTPRFSPRRDGLVPKRNGPPTPLLRWKFNESDDKGEVDLSCNVNVNNNVVGDENLVDGPRKGNRRRTRKKDELVSARKLAAVLWKLQKPEIAIGGGSGGGDGSRLVSKNEDRLGFKRGSGHVGDQLSCHHVSKEYGSEARDPIRSPCSVNGPTNAYLCEAQPLFKFSNYAMEGATKWDPVCQKSPKGDSGVDQKLNTASMVSALQAELEQARSRIDELEAERKSSKKKLEHFLRKLSEERAAWRSREHEKVRAIIEDMKADLSRERKSCQRLEIVNSKLVNELAEAKLAAKRYMQDHEKERKARELIEEVCDELAKEIGEDKAEVESLKKVCMKVREEVEEEKKMLQMAEVWREERVQMKLVDAKVALEEKYIQMSSLIADLENFLRCRSMSTDVKEMAEVEMLRQAAASINVCEMKEFTYDPPKSDDIYAVFEEMMGEAHEREIEQCGAYTPASHASNIHSMSPDVGNLNRDKIIHHRLSNVYDSHYSGDDDDIEDDRSGWETVSQAEDQGSSYSREGSAVSMNYKTHQRDSNISGSFTDWEDHTGGDEIPITEISEVNSVPADNKQLKKVKSISRLWRSCPNNGVETCKIVGVDHGMKSRLSNGRISNGGMLSPDRESGKGGLSPSVIVGHWSSPDSSNPYFGRGMKGCIEWPKSAQKNSLKSKLFEARMESQKIQLRQVLKQKI